MRVAILTNFTEFRRGYSLTGIARDQAEMLARFGHEVRLFVSENYTGNEAIPHGVKLEKKVPFGHLVDLQRLHDLSQQWADTLKAGIKGIKGKDGKVYDLPPDKDMAKKIEDLLTMRDRTHNMLIQELKGKCDLVLTHDWIFQGWNMPYGLACASASKELPDVRWWHWVHSVPMTNRDWWAISLYGKKHKIIYPNKADRQRVAEQYKGWLHDVRVIPHLKDYRSFGQFSTDCYDFLDWCPQLVTADVSQLYPASVDRLEAKRVLETIEVFANIKKLGRSVCLVIANQWTTVDKYRDKVEDYKDKAAKLGLIPGEDLFFTSDFKKEYGVGIPLYLVWELMHFTNLYVSFTKEETYGLGIAEAALCGCLLVLNGSLDVLKEVSGRCALFFNMGSHEINFKNNDPAKYFNDIARIIVSRLDDNETVASKTWYKRMGSLEYQYKQYYAPLMAEALTWVD